MFKNDVINCVREHLDKWYASSNHNETACQLVDEYEERIRADERRKFAEWLVKNMFNGHNIFWKGNTPNNKPLRMEDFIAEYEKEQK